MAEMPNLGTFADGDTFIDVAGWMDCVHNDSMLDELFIEDALNWLDDSDNPYGLSKVWKYLNR